jgi:hypothetical protein
MMNPGIAISAEYWLKNAIKLDPQTTVCHTRAESHVCRYAKLDSSDSKTTRNTALIFKCQI